MMEEIIEEVLLVKEEPEEAVDYPLPNIELVTSPLDVEMPTEHQRIDQYCRLCLRELQNLFPLMSRIQEIPIPEMVLTVTGITVALLGNLPKKVCISCLTKLDYAYNIRKDFMENQRILKSLAQSKMHSLADNLNNYQGGIRVITETYAEKILRQNRDVIRMRLIKKQEYLTSLTDTDKNMSVEKLFDDDIHKPEVILKEEILLDPEELLEQNLDDFIEEEKFDTDADESVREEATSSKKEKQRRKSRRYNVEMKEIKLDPHKCYICDNVFGDADKLKAHLPAHVDMIPYICEKCTTESGKEKKLTSLILLHRHFRMHAGSIKCPQCPFRTCTAVGLYGHVQRYHGEDTETEYTCEVCGTKLMNRRYFENHMRFHKAVDEGRYTCSFCDKRFATKARLVRHERCHTNEKPYQCHYCSKSFNNETSLNGHERTHTGEKGYQCESCGKSYRTNNALKEHIASAHEGTGLSKKCKEYFPKSQYFPDVVKCDVEGCDFSTKLRAKYYSHKAKHEMKFQCPECWERFPTRQRLEQHEYVHTGVKPYCCELCGKSFRFKNSFNEHQAGHKDVRPFACEVCGMSFVRERTLKQHRLKHSDALNYECRQCGKKFKYRADQSKHERMHGEVISKHDNILESESQEGMDIIVEEADTDD